MVTSALNLLLTISVTTPNNSRKRRGSISQARTNITENEMDFIFIFSLTLISLKCNVEKF